MMGGGEEEEDKPKVNAMHEEVVATRYESLI